jgi:acyl-CoA ligase (AMP-forming) (exosortase A-associated)
LVTEQQRRADLGGAIAETNDLSHIIQVGAVTMPGSAGCENVSMHSWEDFLNTPRGRALHRVIDIDGAAIFYTSGSTGRPKGVVLSHANIVAGADSVSQYLQNRSEDRLLAVLPFSFDYGFSQLSTAFHVGASVVLMEYLLPQDIPLKVGKECITGLAGVPPLWNRLADLDWPQAAQDSLRYVTNSGGTMPTETLQKLRRSLPKTQPYLMYGLTEAFRSTYLPPSELDRRPNSIGKAIPNAEVLVMRPDGTVCSDDEPGELVHRGALVALGYWNDPVTTAERFRPIDISGWCPGRPEIAVWSGDVVRRDEEGFLYFIGRRDDLIKTSGYRVSPVEVEEGLFATGLVSAAVALGIPDRQLGEVIATIVVPAPNTAADSAALRAACKQSLPLYMVPSIIEWRTELPRNPNGKYDRAALRRDLISRNGDVSVRS